jgi:hypothetical protein
MAQIRPLLVDIQTLGLQIWAIGAADSRALVPSKSQPLERLSSGLDVMIGNALAIGVLDPEDESPTRVLRVCPIKERGPDVSDMEIASR